MSRPRIAVTLNELPPLSLGDRMAALEAAGVDEWRIDFADGRFVPSLSGSLETARAAVSATKLPVHAHLRMLQPERHLKSIADTGVATISVHVECCRHAHRVMEQIRALGTQAGIALAASTPLTELEYVMHLVSRVVIVCTEPGMRKEPVLESAFERVRILASNLRYREQRADIEVVGGMDASAAARFSKFGATIISIGELALGQDSDPHAAFAGFIDAMASHRHLV